MHQEYMIMAMAWIRAVSGIVCQIIGQEMSAPLYWWPTHWWPPMVLPVLIMGVLAGLRRKEGRPMQDAQQKMEPRHWKLQSDAMAAVILGFFVAMAVLDYLGVVAAKWTLWEAVVPWMWLQFVQSLTFEQGSSWTYKLLTHRVTLEFGRISYTLYLKCHVLSITLSTLYHSTLHSLR